MARTFNGATQYLHASSAAATAPPIAMSCWFWADPAISGVGCLIALNAASPSFQRFELAIDNSPQVVQLYINDGNPTLNVDTATTYSTGAWHHAFGVFYSSTSRKVWLDGGGMAEGTTARTPTSIVHTCLGASRVTAPFSFMNGRLAEAAIWSGISVASMGAAEAAALAGGLSPLGLSRWLSNLVLYQDLIRPANRPGIGPALTEVASPGVAEHARVILPVSQQARVLRKYLYPAPHVVAAAESNGNRTTAGEAAGGRVTAAQIE